MVVFTLNFVDTYFEYINTAYFVFKYKIKINFADRINKAGNVIGSIHPPDRLFPL